MKLLILTQSVDLKNPVLGFFHDWIREFANRFEKVTVICLQKGEYNLPGNVKVLSLGKEEGGSKIKYVFNFYKYLIQERKNYDAVFVHMNEEYILLGGLIWKMFGKKVGMWRNHYAGSFFTKIAGLLSDKVYCTSQFSYTAKFKNIEFMPVGIDTTVFKPQECIRVRGSILFLARMAPSKKPDLLLHALKILKEKGIEFKVSFYGNPIEKDIGYYNKLRKDGEVLGDSVTFYSGIPNRETPTVYSSHEIFVNLSQGGMLDKTIFESVLCGCLPLASNTEFQKMFGDEYVFKENNAVDLAKMLEKMILLSREDKLKKNVLLSDFVTSNHSLSILGDKLSLSIDNIVESNMLEKIILFGRFLTSGVVGVIVNVGILYVLTHFLQFWYLFSAIVSFCLATIISFIMQKYFAFQDSRKRGVKKQFNDFVLLAFINLGVNTLLMYLFVDGLHVWYVHAQLLASAMIAVESFFVYKYLIFGFISQK